MAFLFGIPKRLLRRIREIEIDTHYYDKDVIPSAQEIFTYDVDKKKEVATITGLVNSNTITAVIPYQIHYDQTSRQLIAKVTDLSERCFSNNNSLKQITIPNTIHVIPSNCFKNCLALESVNIPSSIHTIKVNAFNNCDSLKSVFIPYGVNTIEAGAFKDCDKLKIICYKHSTAEEYAIANDIPYSLISYTLDDDITENSENLVTSGVIYGHVSWIKTRIETIYKELLNKIAIVQTNLTNHITNKHNPHDESTFDNPNLTGHTTLNKGTLINLNTVSENINGEDIVRVTDDSLINKKYVDDSLNDAIKEIRYPSVGTGYQKIYDDKLETKSKTIVTSINEINRRSNTISGKLEAGWNTISLNRLYTDGWRFMNQPYCFTDEGINVDFRIKDTKISSDTIIDNKNTFKIYVPCTCNFTCSTTTNNSTKILSGTPVDYLVLTYYYTGNDGKDLDTVTGISNTNWPSKLKSTVGYGHGDTISSNGTTLIKWGGDNTGGGTNAGSSKFYESVYFDISAIQQQLPEEDIEIILYGTWYSEVGEAKINVSIECFTSITKPNINVNNNTKQITLSNLTISDETIQNPTYSNINEPILCEIPTKRGSAQNYKNEYTPAFKITFHKSDSESNYRTISIQPLS